VQLQLSSPGQLGLARAYVAGELDVSGDMYTALSRLADLGVGHLTFRDKARLARALAPFAKTLRRPEVPPEEVRLHGGRHSKRRDGNAIHHHYDVSNRFYRWVLGPSMAYTCAVYPAVDATLEQAQDEKFDLVCRKLGLTPGQRLLDVGCGWGGMVLHAVKNYGVTAVGVTLSKQQAEYAQRAIADAGLGDKAQVRFQDYRDVPESNFDAISSIGLTEHIGLANYPSYFGFLRGRLRPEGRLLNHCITRTDTHAKTSYRNGFINRYVFPDGELVPASRVMAAIEEQHLEIHHEENLRQHYAMTLRDWCRNLDEHWDEAVEEVGPGKARVWRLYMAASRLGFDRDMIQLHQVLATRTQDDGSAGIPLRPWF
jgi:cyclopropane-fatty-acyl-phospholipid synthase